MKILILLVSVNRLVFQSSMSLKQFPARDMKEHVIQVGDITFLWEAVYGAIRKKLSEAIFYIMRWREELSWSGGKRPRGARDSSTEGSSLFCLRQIWGLTLKVRVRHRKGSHYFSFEEEIPLPKTSCQTKVSSSSYTAKCLLLVNARLATALESATLARLSKGLRTRQSLARYAC